MTNRDFHLQELCLPPKNVPDSSRHYCYSLLSQQVFCTGVSEGKSITLLMNELIQTALIKTIFVILVLVFTAVAIVALPVSVVLVTIVFPVLALFKIPKALVTFLILEEQRNTVT